MNRTAVDITPQRAFVATIIGLGALFAIAGFLPSAGPGSDRLDAFMSTHEKKYSQFNEELLVRYYFRDKRGGVFVDIGCAWPLRNSTTYFLESELGWHGVGVDALGLYKLSWLRRRPASQFRQYAVSDQSGGTITFYQSAWTGVSSLSEDHVVLFSKEEAKPVQVAAITMDDLLDQEGIERFDFLSMDIEGAEPRALAGFDIDRFKPELACVEGRKTDYEAAVRAYFAAHGYEPIKAFEPYDAINMWFRRP